MMANKPNRRCVMVRLKVRYWYTEVSGTIFVRLAFSVSRELAKAIKRELSKKYNNKNIIFTPYLSEDSIMEDSIIVELQGLRALFCLNREKEVVNETKSYKNNNA